MQEKSKPVDNLRADAEKIITRAIAAVLPDAAVERALKGKTFLGRVYLVAAGKAAWQMAHAARACLQDNFCGGVVVTKYGHVKVRSRMSRALRAGIPCRTKTPCAARTPRSR